MNAAKRIRRGANRLSLGALGMVLIVSLLGASLIAYNKEAIGSLLSSGTSVEAEFGKYHVMPDYRTNVKVAGVVVGRVTGVEFTDRDTTVVTMKVDDDVVSRLGNEATASIRPTLLLEGAYYIDLVPKGTGEFEGRIPLERTATPVQLGEVLSSFTPSARDAMQKVIGQTGATFAEDGRNATKQLLATAPDTLRPASVVLQAARGTNPDSDLTALVSGFQHTANALTRRQGQLDSIVDSLDKSTAALVASSPEIAAFAANGRDSFRATREGMIDLRPTLDRLTDTAPQFQESAKKLDSLTDKLAPALSDARPVVSDLRSLLKDARPLVDDLTPSIDKATDALDDLRGPVLDRLNGPIVDALNEKWSGHGPYENGGNNGARTYEELSYLFAHASKIYQFYDHNGSVPRLAVGTGANGVLGGQSSPRSAYQYLEQLRLGPGDPNRPPGPPADRDQNIVPIPKQPTLPKVDAVAPLAPPRAPDGQPKPGIK